MGSGGSGTAGGGSSAGGGGWGGTMNNSYSGGNLGGLGTAGVMSGGAGGSGMMGYGGGGVAGVRDSGWGGSGGSAGRQPVGGYISTDNFGNQTYHAPAASQPYAATRASGNTPGIHAPASVINKYKSVPGFSTPIPTQTSALSPALTAITAPYARIGQGVTSIPGQIHSIERATGVFPAMRNQGSIGPQVGIHSPPTSGMAGHPAGVGLPGGSYSGSAGTNALGNTGGYSGNFSSMGGRGPPGGVGGSTAGSGGGHH